MFPYKLQEDNSLLYLQDIFTIDMDLLFALKPIITINYK